MDGQDRSPGIIRCNDLVQVFLIKKREVSRAENQDNANGEGCSLLPEILSPLSRDLDTGEIRQDPMAVGYPRQTSEDGQVNPRMARAPG